MANISCDPQSLDNASRCFVCIPSGFKPIVNVSLLNMISGVRASPQSLLDLSRGFDKFEPIAALGAEVYLLALLALKGSLSPSDLANQAACFGCGRDGDLDDIATYLYAVDAGGSTVPADLITAAKGYTVLFGMEWRASLYLTCQWAFAAGVVSSCEPSALLTASRCFTNCLSPYTLRAVRTFLLCNLVAIGVSGDLIPFGSDYNGAGTFTLNVLANSYYSILWGSNDVSVLIGSSTYYGGAGNTSIVFTGSSTTMIFTGTFAGTTVTLVVINVPKPVPPIPTNFTWALSADGTQVVATWDVPPAGVTKTELWTADIGKVMKLAATLAAPGTTVSVPAPAPGQPLWAEIRWCNATSCGAFTASQQVNSWTARVTDWATRVVNNGGAAPTSATKAALNTFDVSMVSAGLDTLMWAVCCLVPDSLIAAITPFYKAQSNDPWINHNFVAGDLTVNGLLGNGNNKYLDTGFNMVTAGYPNNATAFVNMGATVYVSLPSNSGSGEFGATDAGSTLGPVLYTSYLGNTIADLPADAAQASRITVANGNWAGYLSANNPGTGGNARSVYKASSTFPHAVIGSNNNAEAVGSNNLSCFAMTGNLAGAPATPTDRRVSFIAVHKGLTAAQSQTFFNAIQALRTALGGGFI